MGGNTLTESHRHLSHRHIVTSSHRRIVASHRHIVTCHIVTSSHIHIVTSHRHLSPRHIVTSHRHITSSPCYLVTSSPSSHRLFPRLLQVVFEPDAQDNNKTTSHVATCGYVSLVLLVIIVIIVILIVIRVSFVLLVLLVSLVILILTLALQGQLYLYHRRQLGHGAHEVQAQGHQGEMLAEVL